LAKTVRESNEKITNWFKHKRRAQVKQGIMKFQVLDLKFKFLKLRAFLEEKSLHSTGKFLFDE